MYPDEPAECFPTQPSTLYRCNCRVNVGTVECRPTELSKAAVIAKKMLQTYFITWHELKRLELVSTSY